MPAPIARAMTGIAVIAGLVSPVVITLTEAEIALVSADSLLGSPAAIIVGGTGIPTPSVSFAQHAEDLYLHPLGFDGGATDSSVCDMAGADPCNGVLQVLTTPETIHFGTSMPAGATDIVNAVENEFSDNPGEFDAEHPLTVFAYSQGAASAGMAEVQLADAGIPLDDVHFVFIGDPADNGGIMNNVVPDLDAKIGSTLTDWLLKELNLQNIMGGTPGVPTPDDLYQTTEYMLRGDGFANFQRDVDNGGLSNALNGMFYQHREYMGLTPQQIADSTTVTHDEITKFDISDAIDNQQAFADSGHMATDTDIIENDLVTLIDDVEKWF